MNEYLGTEIIFAFRDIKLIWNKKLVYILVKKMCDLLSLSFSKKHEKSALLSPSSLETHKKKTE